MEMRRVPAFGDWNNTSDFHIAQYFDSIHDHCWIEEEYDHNRFYASSTATPKFVPNPRKVKGNGNGNGNGHEKQQQGKKQKRTSVRAVKPVVDEDLYKIPPELLYQKSKKKRMVRSLWSGCMRVTCVA